MCCRQAYPSTGRLLCVSRSVGIWRFRWIAGGCPRWTAGQLAIPWRVWKWGFPQVTAMSIGAIDDQSESIIIVFLGSLFSDKPMKWYREHCHVFLVDFVIGGWNTSRQPYMVCPNTPNSHSGSSLSLVNWQHVGLSPFLDINPSSCGFSVEFAPVGGKIFVGRASYCAGGWRHEISHMRETVLSLAKNDLMMANGWSG